MGAPAEAHVLLRVTTVEPQQVGVVEDLGVAIRRRPGEHQPIALGEVAASEPARPSYDPVVELEGRLEPHDLLHEARNQIRGLAQSVGEGGLLREDSNRRAQQRGRRLATGPEEDDGDANGVLAPDPAVADAAGQELEERCVGVRPEPGLSLAEMLREVLGHPAGLLRQGDELVGIDGTGQDVAPHHRPAPKVSDVGVGKPEQARDGVRRHGLREGYEVSAAAGQERLERGPHPDLEIRLEPLDDACCQTRL